MDEQRMNKELDEMLAMLKAVEHKILENSTFSEMKDVIAIHLAVLHGYYDISDALEFIKSMYTKEEE